MTKNAVWVAESIGVLLALAAVSGISMAAESKPMSSASYTAVMFVVSAPQSVLGNFTALQEEKVYKDSGCKKPEDPTPYKPNFLRPSKWKQFKYGDLLFVECRNPSPEVFQLFAQASLKASGESAGRTVKVLFDTITISSTISPAVCQNRYCGADNSFHQAFPRPESPCSYCEN